MQCLLTCVVGYIAPTLPSPPPWYAQHKYIQGFHGDINRYVKYKISVISSHHVGARLLYINEKTKKRNVCIHLCVYVAIYV